MLVLGGNLALAPGGDDGPSVSFADSAAVPQDWLHFRQRIGLLHSNGHTWQQARVASDGRAESIISGATCTVSVSPGLKPLGTLQTATATRHYDLQRLDEQSAVDSLLRVLPADLRQRQSLPIHQLAALPDGRLDIPAIPLLSANADGSVTLARMLAPGEKLRWASRQPLAAENDMRETLQASTPALHSPTFGIQLSCIGRGPLFYGSDDRDLLVWRERFPGVPLIGAYGSGQIAPHGEKNQQWQNAVVTALFTENHV